MRPIQFVLLAFSCFALAKVLQRILRRRVPTLDMVFWIVLWTGTAFVILLPDTTNFIAELLGIWRGADLVVYVSLLVMFYLIFRIHLALERLEQGLTSVVRELALAQAHLTAPGPDQTAR